MGKDGKCFRAEISSEKIHYKTAGGYKEVNNNLIIDKGTTTTGIAVVLVEGLVETLVECTLEVCSSLGGFVFEMLFNLGPGLISSVGDVAKDLIGKLFKNSNTFVDGMGRVWKKSDISNLSILKKAGVDVKVDEFYKIKKNIIGEIYDVLPKERLDDIVDVARRNIEIDSKWLKNIEFGEMMLKDLYNMTEKYLS